MVRQKWSRQLGHGASLNKYVVVVVIPYAVCVGTYLSIHR